jgi:hypothetical protein
MPCSRNSRARNMSDSARRNTGNGKWAAICSAFIGVLTGASGNAFHSTSHRDGEGATDSATGA